MPIISVVIPVFNGEKTIQATLESVLKQTFKNFEIIIIDDGSFDSTLEIISKISDSRIKVFSYANSGASVSRNRGFSHACGEFIALLDADDLWTVDKLESQLTVLEENPQAMVAYSWSDCIEESGNFLRPSCHFTYTGNVFANLLVANFIGNGSVILVRQQVVKEIGDFNESLQAAQDWDWYLRLAYRYEFVVVPRVQVLYRESKNSISSHVNRLEEASITVIKKAFYQAPVSLDYLKKYSLANLYKYLIFKALNYPLERSVGLTTIKFIGYVIKNEPIFLKKQPKLLIKAFYKSVLVIFLSPLVAQKVFSKFPRISNTTAFLFYINTNPF